MASSASRRRAAAKVAVWVSALTPAAWLAWRATHGQLGANPIEEVLHRTGWWGLLLLTTTLAITPVRRLSTALPASRRFIRLLLPYAPLQHLPSVGSVARVGIHLGGHRGAAVHHRRFYVHARVGPPPGREVAAASPAHLSGFLARCPALLLEGQGRHTRATDLRRRHRPAVARACARRPATGLTVATVHPRIVRTVTSLF